MQNHFLGFGQLSVQMLSFLSKTIWKFQACCNKSAQPTLHNINFATNSSLVLENKSTNPD